MSTDSTVRKLWSLCKILRDDGISYQDYVTELSYLLFLKLMDQNSTPQESHWRNLMAQQGQYQLDFYHQLITKLSQDQDNDLLARIFCNVQSKIRNASNLRHLLSAIDIIGISEQDHDHFANLYEAILSKNAGERKSGAGQYFTPRPLIETIIHCVKPQLGESILDPAAGTGGFLIYANKYIQQHSNNDNILASQTLFGIEIVADTYRLALMNFILHHMSSHFFLGDALKDVSRLKQPVDIILTNPPFGISKDKFQYQDCNFPFKTTNKQFNFLQYIDKNLKIGGRAAVIVSDHVLFEDNIGTKIREHFINTCNVHTILRLPTGIFYAPGVKTNVLFFSKGEHTKQIWVYDLRTNMPVFGKTNPLQSNHFEDFIHAFGTDEYGRSPRIESERFKCFAIDEIRHIRNYNLDIRWLEDNLTNNENLEDLITEAQSELTAMLTSLAKIKNNLHNAVQNR